MANTSVVFGRLKGGHSVLNSDFVSQTVPSGGTSNACPASFNYCIITPIDGNVYAAFGQGTANAANVSARIPLTQNVPASFYTVANTVVSFVDRT